MCGFVEEEHFRFSSEAALTEEVGGSVEATNGGECRD
jgi:hypothetical protein